MGFWPKKGRYDFLYTRFKVFDTRDAGTLLGIAVVMFRRCGLSLSDVLETASLVWEQDVKADKEN